MIQGMEHFPYKDRLRAGAGQPGEEKALGGHKCGLTVSKVEDIKRKGSDSLVGSVVIGLRENGCRLKEG